MAPQGRLQGVEMDPATHAQVLPEREADILV